jgi:cytosine/uracil/thiamine/allantoin permease
MQVFIRLGIVLVVLGAIAGAILATYFLTRQFS